LQVI